MGERRPPAVTHQDKAALEVLEEEAQLLRSQEIAQAEVLDVVTGRGVPGGVFAWVSHPSALLPGLRTDSLLLLYRLSIFPSRQK